jgi:predicted dehydrogenase
MKLNQPLDIALVGTGFRSQTVYRLLFAALRARGVRLVAVCDPVRKSADAYAESLGVRAFYSIRELVEARPMEAAIICTPVELFHPISSYLSQNGIHNIVEAGFSHTLTQARAMIRTAQANNVVLAVGEQFFRLLPRASWGQSTASSASSPTQERTTTAVGFVSLARTPILPKP